MIPELTQQVVLLGLLLVALPLLNTALPTHSKGPPVLVNAAHVRTTVMVLVAGPLLVVFCSPAAATVALVMNGPAAVGRTTMPSVVLPLAAMVPLMVQVTVVLPLATQPAVKPGHGACGSRKL